MKTKFLTFLLFTGLFLIHKTGFATHIMGGEITWECQNNGQYVFTLKVYRDCNGVNFNVVNEAIEVHNYPAAGGITLLPLNFISVTDITPSCEGSPCAGLTPADPDIRGAIEEYVLKTNPVTLNGVPGVNGWIFSWTSGNRNASIDNIQNADNFGITLRAKMFAYNGQNANACFDSSPDFFQKPSSIICAGEKFTYNHSAFDNELDSLSYSWARPLDGNACNNRPCQIGGLFVENTNPPFVGFDGAQGYSFNSPFPNAGLDARNVPAVLNPATGEITFTSYNQGEFVSVIKVTAYKCGQKVAEIFRELQTVILSGCAINEPPIIPPPFANGTYSDTVRAGDFVNFNISIFDTLSIDNPKNDTIYIFGSGQQFGANFTDSTSGCLNPPCATLTAPLSDTSVGSYFTQFKWQTSCDHLANSTPVCYASQNTYLFIIRAFDDFCPAAGQAIASFSITVISDSLMSQPEIHCADVLANGDVAIDWNQTNDPDNSFIAWMIYASPARSGPYTLIDSIFDYNQTSYTHLGAGANSQGMHYIVRAKSACHDGWTIEIPDTISTIFINPTFNNTCVDINWNALDSPLPDGSPAFYNIYREYPIGSGFAFYKTSNTTNICDTFSVCADTVTYRIEMTNSGNGCPGSNSNVKGIRFQYPLPIAEAGNALNLCTGQSGTIGGAPSGPSGSQYFWTPSDSISSLIVANPIVNPIINTRYYLTITDSNNCHAIDSVDVILQPTPIANAGVNAIICKEDLPYNLNGSVSITNAGRWIDGTGTFAPGRNTLTPTYSPSAAEISAGFADLRFISRNVGICDVDTDNIRITIPAFSGAIVISSNPVDCNGNNTGSASISMFGGNAPYTYSWNGPSGPKTGSSVSNLLAGTYTVTITNSFGCDSIRTIAVTQPGLLSSTISSTSNVTCNGINNGTALAAGSGGTAPYSYLWNDGQTNAQANNLAAATYTVTVSDANGCSSVSNVSLTEPSALVFSSANSTPTSCNGSSDGVASIVASGGSAPYTYNWSNGSSAFQATNLSAGNYTVTLSDANGCTSTNTITVSQPSILNLTISSSSNVSCLGLSDGSATANASGGTLPYTYSWSNGQNTSMANNLAAGSYDITVTDGNGCTNTLSTILSEPALFVSSIPGSNRVSCNGLNDGQATAKGDGGTSPYTYSWSDGQTTKTASNLVAGTYSVTILDANGCSSSSSVTINQPNPLVCSISSNTPISCNGLTDGSAIATGTGGTSPYTYLWSNGQTGNQATGLAVGSFTVTLTDSKGCSSIATTSINQPAVLVSSIASSINVSCNGLNDGSINSTASGGTAPYTYLWSNGQTTSQAINLSIGTYTITISDANSCSSVASTSISQPNLLTGNISATSQVTCQGLNNGIASINASGGTMPYTYLWSNGQSNFQAINLIAGTYTVTLSDANACSSIASVVITEPNVLSSSIASSTNVTCNGLNDGMAALSVSGGTLPYTYNWSSGQNTALISNLVAGNYTVTVTDLNSCTTVLTVPISEPTALSTSISSNVDVSCNGLSDGTATVSATGGTNPYTYLWSDGQNTAQAINLNAGIFSVTVSDINGCSSSTSINIGEPLVLANTISNTTQVSCNGLNDGIASIQVSGGTSPYTYLWSNGQTTAQSINLIAGTYTVTSTDANSCTQVSTVVITEPSPLLTTISGNDISCKGLRDGSANIIASGGTSPYSYRWSNNLNGSSIANLFAGTYSVIVQDLNSCKDTLSFIVNEPSQLQITITPSDTICVNTSKNIVAQGSGGTGNLTYTWDQSLGSNPSINVNPTSKTTYIVSVTDQNNCPPATASSTVDIRNIFNDQLLVSSAGNICFGDSSLVSTSFIGGIGPFTFTWNQELVGIQDQYAKPNATTSYILEVRDVCNNKIADTVLIQVSPKPPLNLPDTIIKGCAPLSLNFSNNSSSTLVYTWFFGDGSSSNQMNPTHVFVNPGLYNIGLRVRTIQGCLNEFTGNYNIQVNPSPRANFTADPTVTNIDLPTISFFASYGDATSWTWFFGNGDSSSAQNPIYTYADTGLFSVQFSKLNRFDCPDTRYLNIRIEPSVEIDIPNVFIPNTGGSTGGRYDPTGISNEVFHPFLKYVQNYSLQIFNRWGELIFESKDVSIGWDGYYRGQLSQADVYVYKLEVEFTNGKKATKIGDVTLLR